MNDCIWLASFDIGKKNFAFCVEELRLDDLKSIQNIPRCQRYNKDGSCTIEFNRILKSVYSTGKIILLENIDLTYDCNKNVSLDPQLYINMYTVLDKYKHYWDKCVSFVVEQQMGFGKKRNYMALKLGQHCLSYFIFNYSSFKHTIEFPSYHKTKIFGASKNLTKYQRKKWAVDKAIEILNDRNDIQSIKQITDYKKRDDMSDIIVQLQSYKYLMFIDKSL
jgi:hypothetical protein